MNSSSGKLFFLLLATIVGDAGAENASDIELELKPSVCALSSTDRQCHVAAHAQWHASHDESLCLVILERPDVRQCWEHYLQGTYSIDLVFDQDVIFQLQDLQSQDVLASATLRVIREALQYRHRRRDPWSLFG